MASLIRIPDGVKYMNRFMNDIALNTFSVFDAGKKAGTNYEPERFYHGFVLGLMVDLADRYTITSNRESGFGRYDVCLEPKDQGPRLMCLNSKYTIRNRKKTLKTQSGLL